MFKIPADCKILRTYLIKEIVYTHSWLTGKKSPFSTLQTNHTLKHTLKVLKTPFTPSQLEYRPRFDVTHPQFDVEVLIVFEHGGHLADQFALELTATIAS